MMPDNNNRSLSVLSGAILVLAIILLAAVLFLGPHFGGNIHIVGPNGPSGFVSPLSNVTLKNI